MLERELHCLHRAIHLIFVCVIILTRTCLCNILRYFSGVKTEHFHQKEVGIPNIFVQSMHRGYPQCMFWIKNKKNMYTPVHPGFTI